MSDPNDKTAPQGDPEKPAGQDEERGEDLLMARQEFMQIFKRGAEFTEELLKENERLRYRSADLEARAPAGNAQDDSLLKELMEKVGRLEEEREELRRRFSEVEAENRDFASRYVEVETENNNLLNIYVASYQLHSTLDFQEVLQIITEIVLNFVGAEVFLVGILDERSGGLRPLVVEGISRDEMGSVSTDSGLIKRVLEEGEPCFVDNLEILSVEVNNPGICIPLKIKDNIIGIIAIYKFLPQKTQLQNVDHELFTLLAGHAATAIFSAKLYTESKRKLNTIQGLIDLVTS